MVVVAAAAGTYPRVCGGNIRQLGRGREQMNLSPRVRGKPGSAKGNRGPREPIPACAGETPCADRPPDYGGTYPRVCGGNLPGRGGVRGIRNLSPRVRGKLVC